jgi:hypothetical protein
MGWTQPELARRLEVEGVHLAASGVNRVEKHARGISLDEAIALVRVCRLDPAAVLAVLADIDTAAPASLAGRLVHTQASAAAAHDLADRVLLEVLGHPL